MKKYIVDLSGRLVRNSPTGWFGFRYPLGGYRPRFADRRYDRPLNGFGKVVCLIVAGATVLFALNLLWQFVGPSITDSFTTGWRTTWK
jgi:hypothetical protein